MDGNVTVEYFNALPALPQEGVFHAGTAVAIMVLYHQVRQVIGLIPMIHQPFAGNCSGVRGALLGLRGAVEQECRHQARNDR